MSAETKSRLAGSQAAADRARRKVGGNDETGASHDANAGQPKVPGDDKAGELVEAELGPLVEAAFERHDAVKINNNGGDRQIEKKDGEEPISGLRWAEFGGGADP